MTNNLANLCRFFCPPAKASFKSGLWFVLSRVMVTFGSVYLLITLLLAVLPVPFSAYMAQQKISHWLEGESYPIDYRWVPLEQMAWQIQMAAIAAEDQKFDDHFGIDLAAIENALNHNAQSDKKPRGASTISQQTVKNLYLWHGTSWLRKAIELPLTFLVESLWSKKRVLEVYLNIAEFGKGLFGVEAAAQHYFQKSAAKLNLEEAALLAAALPNPHLFKVSRPNAAMKRRQAWIIRQIHNLDGKRYLENL